MFYSKRQDGQPAKSRRFSPKGRDFNYEVEPGYDSARDILNRMVDRGELKVFRSRGKTIKRNGEEINFNRPNLYCLPGTKKPIDDKKLYGHEMDIADCFAALRKTFGERLARWQLKWDKGDEYDYMAGRWKLFPDAVFELEDAEPVYFLEVDRGTMEWDQIVDKLDRYVRFSNAHPEHKFHVLFTCQAYRHDKEDMDRLRRLMPMLEVHRRANQFVVACHEDFKADPAGAVFHSPVDATFQVITPKGGRPYKLLAELGQRRPFLAL